MEQGGERETTTLSAGWPPVIVHDVDDQGRGPFRVPEQQNKHGSYNIPPSR